MELLPSWTRRLNEMSTQHFLPTNMITTTEDPSMSHHFVESANQTLSIYHPHLTYTPTLSSENELSYKEPIKGNTQNNGQPTTPEDFVSQSSDTALERWKGSDECHVTTTWVDGPDGQSVQPRQDVTTSKQKRTTRGQTQNQEKPRSKYTELPPCRVCGAQATGFHYGVNSCEACKGFFRRCLVRKKEPMECLKGGACKPGRQNMCQYCRMQRCKAVGMSVQGIKTGRYTFEKKARDLEEIRKLRQEEYARLYHSDFLMKRTRAMELVMLILSSQDRHLQGSIQRVDSLASQLQVGRNEVLAAEKPDGRGLDKFYRGLEEGLIKSIKFMKDLPAFKKLCMTDKSKLIKESFLEMWIISRYKSFVGQTGVYVAQSGQTVSFRSLLGSEFTETLLRFKRSLDRLQLTINEIIVLKVWVHFFPDRCVLAQPTLVEEGQREIQAGLELLLDRNHPGEEHMLAKVLGTLTTLRELSHFMFKNRNQLLHSLDSQAAPLLHELLQPS